MLSVIAIIGKNRAIGRKNKLLWNLPEDLARFRRITKNHPIIMGRKTFESIGRLLPERTNIIVSRNPDYKITGGHIFNSLEAAIEFAKISPGKEEIFVIGGGEIYTSALPYCDKLYLTIVADEPEADVFFPDFSSFKNIKETGRGNFDKVSYKFLELTK